MSLKADALDQPSRRNNKGTKALMMPTIQRMKLYFLKTGVFRKSPLKWKGRLLGLLWLNQQGQRRRNQTELQAIVFRDTREGKEGEGIRRRGESHKGCKLPENRGYSWTEICLQECSRVQTQATAAAP